MLRVGRRTEAWNALQPLLSEDTQFGPRKMVPYAQVGAGGEGEMALLRAIDVEDVRICVYLIVAAGHSQYAGNHITLTKGDAEPFAIVGDDARIADHRV